MDDLDMLDEACFVPDYDDTELVEDPTVLIGEEGEEVTRPKCRKKKQRKEVQLPCSPLNEVTPDAETACDYWFCSEFGLDKRECPIGMNFDHEQQTCIVTHREFHDFANAKSPRFISDPMQQVGLMSLWRETCRSIPPKLTTTSQPPTAPSVPEHVPVFVPIEQEVPKQLQLIASSSADQSDVAVVRQVHEDQKRQINSSYCQCFARGDPTYETCDGASINFQGECTYTLVTNSTELPEGVLPFHIAVKNTKSSFSPIKTYTKTVRITVAGHTIDMSTTEGKSDVMVDGRRELLPYQTELFTIIQIKNGPSENVRMRFTMADTGLMVFATNSGKHRVGVVIPNAYRDKLCGLCGNFNGNMDDDFTTANGTFVGDHSDKNNLVGNSHRIADPDDDDECRSQPLVPGCRNDENDEEERENDWGRCTARGDPIYQTYDGYTLKFHGDCTYLLTGTCYYSQDDLPQFEVLVTNAHPTTNNDVTFTKKVSTTFNINGVETTVDMYTLQGVDYADVDGVRVYLTVPHRRGHFTLLEQNGRIALVTAFGLIVRAYNTGKHRISVDVPSEYQRMLCGLCGDFNRDPNDELRLQSGELLHVDESDPWPAHKAFGESWQVHVEGEKASCATQASRRSLWSFGDGVGPTASVDKRTAGTGRSLGSFSNQPVFQQNNPWTICSDVIRNLLSDCLMAQGGLAEANRFTALCAYAAAQAPSNWYSIQLAICEVIAKLVDRCSLRRATVEGWVGKTGCGQFQEMEEGRVEVERDDKHVMSANMQPAKEVIGDTRAGPSERSKNELDRLPAKIQSRDVVLERIKKMSPASPEHNTLDDLVKQINNGQA
ncbi:uncharacterized protein LOC106172586 [Lingula anatina]|uniref:Uncharacterized protein LOC106172586 n=1 Tax=Lingula anatina TaxID=7574 RepID=A0A1S3JF93_LINAN|nr:uncharacterized protein LOC106172586 [Lingula anatina]|eukprot:XP_013408821.1 uncharacterized protein LOC106172586 [Lingula anatina]